MAAEKIPPILEKAFADSPLDREGMVALLSLPDGRSADRLFNAADVARKEAVGDDVPIRGIIEFSNVCFRNCLYCGLRKDNGEITRYRMPDEEIVATALRIREAGVGTVVLQSGEDPFYHGERLAELTGRIKRETGLVITLSVGERPYEDYRLFREAGAERFLLKHETASRRLYERLRPGTDQENRNRCLWWLRDLGYQVGAGNMVGLPGQAVEDLADDILFVKSLEADMIGIGPFIPHARTPLAGSPAGSLGMTLRVVALTRLVLPRARIPAATALDVIDEAGRRKGLTAGANVFMVDFTPQEYRRLYDIYPGKGTVEGDAVDGLERMKKTLESLGRKAV